jgi:hypothetical protein
MNRFVVTVVLCLLATTLAAGQDTGSRARPMSSALALALLCINEAGWDCFESGDGLAIHEVLLRGAHRNRMSYAGFARAYAGRLFGARPHRVSRMHWVGELTPDCTEPPSWPRVSTRRVGGSVRVVEHPPWSHYVDSCRSVMERAREVVSLSLDNVEDWSRCESPVHDWGGSMDRDRAARIGLVEIECGETANDFYCRPGVDIGCRDASEGPED